LADCRDGIASVGITIDIPENMIVHGDESKLRRTFSNLINQCVDVLHDHQTKDAAVNISADTKDDTVFIQVRDNGPGVPPEIINTLLSFVTKQKVRVPALGWPLLNNILIRMAGIFLLKIITALYLLLVCPYSRYSYQISIIEK